MKPIKINEELENKIINSAYGTGNIFDKIHIKFLSIKYTEVKKLYNEYKATSSALSKIEMTKCPDEIIEQAKKVIKFQERKSKLFLSPRLVGAVGSVFVILIVLWSFNQNEETKFTQDEIYSAYSDAEESLTLIAEVFGDSKTTIETEMFGEELEKPFSEGVNSINTIMYNQSELLKDTR
ncbi:MAG: hypothetical protein JW866_09140 [Ignavibacteriales bacterium]|nr:hypothetical protein [Ignavibacteriales bacterium]